MAEIAQRNKGIEVLNKKLRKNRANGEFDQISDGTDEYSVRSRPSSTTKVKILNKQKIETYKDSERKSAGSEKGSRKKSKKRSRRDNDTSDEEIR